GSGPLATSCHWPTASSKAKPQKMSEIYPMCSRKRGSRRNSSMARMPRQTSISGMNFSRSSPRFASKFGETVEVNIGSRSLVRKLLQIADQRAPAWLHPRHQQELREHPQQDGQHRQRDDRDDLPGRHVLEILVCRVGAKVDALQGPQDVRSGN